MTLFNPSVTPSPAMARLLALQTLLATVIAQRPGDLKAEVHPRLEIAHCTRATGCTAESKAVVIDSNW